MPGPFYLTWSVSSKFRTLAFQIDAKIHKLFLLLTFHECIIQQFLSLNEVSHGMFKKATVVRFKMISPCLCHLSLLTTSLLQHINHSLLKLEASEVKSLSEDFDTGMENGCYTWFQYMKNTVTMFFFQRYLSPVN